ncbi:O-antigen ligase [Fibrobacter sp. UWB13]|uniref:O-antigen ligase family protein n=1 Tax=Fibrobacter sp. UWB13 TaxID=1896204 RepID=UPI0015937466|nr:O-antigen ligase family protein [Fibrobacter sp. UWB13]
MIIGGYVSLLLILLTVVNRSSRIDLRNIFVWLLLSLFFGSQLVYATLFKGYETSYQYSLNFIIFGFVPLYFLLNVNNFKLLIYCAFIISCVNGLVLLLDPLNDYCLSGNYMGYGFDLLMFSFSGLLFGFYALRKKILLAPIIIELSFIVIYGNKGAALGALAMLLVMFFFQIKSISKLILSLVIFLILANWKLLLSAIVSQLMKFNLPTYSLLTLQLLVLDESDQVYSARTNIWNVAIEWIERNPFWGNGICTFDEFNNGYVHNVFLEITLAYGYMGLIVFVGLLVHSIFLLVKMNDPYKRFFQLILLVGWLVPMQFSLTIWNVSLFWIYIGIYLLSITGKKDESFSQYV